MMIILLIYFAVLTGCQGQVPSADPSEDMDLPLIANPLYDNYDSLLSSGKDLLLYDYKPQKMTDEIADAYNDFWYGEANIDDVQGLPVQYDDQLEQGNIW